MKKTVKILAIMLVLLLALGALFACSKPGSDDKPAATDSAESGEVEPASTDKTDDPAEPTEDNGTAADPDGSGDDPVENTEGADEGPINDGQDGPISVETEEPGVETGDGDGAGGL
ncbi:MAG: hypothetical protein II124_04065 [Clostridia bacterium]|nr:hypothetical protein [Clostridia bacterium]MBQ4341231.1 hypothetical protein [Clostridia bacterium]